MMVSKTETENLDEIKEERDRLFLFVLRLIHADSTTRNRILNSMKPEKVKRPVGRPKKHTPELLDKWLNDFEAIKADAREIIAAAKKSVAAGNATDKEKAISKVGRITDGRVLVMIEIIRLDLNRKGLYNLNSEEFKRYRKTKKTLLSATRKSRKLT